MAHYNIAKEITAADVGAVPTTRVIATQAPLVGGGNLSTDLLLSINVFGPSGVTHSTGAVPDPGAIAGTTKFLREDGTWQVPAGGGSGTVTNIATTAPLTGGPITTTGTIAIPAATSIVDGYLVHTDWVIFNAKVSTTRAINTTAPLTGGGDLSADRTLAIPAANGSTNGYLTSTDWTTFNNKSDDDTLTWMAL